MIEKNGGKSSGKAPCKVVPLINKKDFIDEEKHRLSKRANEMIISLEELYHDLEELDKRLEAACGNQ